jgi:hypothetical protein
MRFVWIDKWTEEELDIAMLSPAARLKLGLDDACDR